MDWSTNALRHSHPHSHAFTSEQPAHASDGPAANSPFDTSPFRSHPNATEQSLQDLEAMLRALHRLAKDGFAPKRTQLCREAGLTDTTYLKFFPSYSAFVAHCGYRPAIERRSAQARQRLLASRGVQEEAPPQRAEAGTSVTPETAGVGVGAGVGSRPQRKLESIFGDLLFGYDMIHAPVNEQGVVVLFAMMARELGFLIELVRQGYPDCEAKRKCGEHKWRRVRIEFEYATSRFDHDPAGCDLIVCWIHDSKRCEVEVLELSRILRERAEQQSAKPDDAAVRTSAPHPITSREQRAGSKRYPEPKPPRTQRARSAAKVARFTPPTTGSDPRLFSPAQRADRT
ncbi:MAG: hypothetical protein KF805_16830 [Phycisphaeraceae bacterium]|nr:hypothetical protein [Phycisphaeraceae bacterium]